jgi:hypothetical protein
MASLVVVDSSSSRRVATGTVTCTCTASIVAPQLWRQLILLHVHFNVLGF